MLPRYLSVALTHKFLDLIGILPEDPEMTKLETKGVPLTELPPDSLLKKGISEIARKLGLV